jgi:hypothetical protein
VLSLEEPHGVAVVEVSCEPGDTVLVLVASVGRAFVSKNSNSCIAEPWGLGHGDIADARVLAANIQR